MANTEPVYSIVWKLKPCGDGCYEGTISFPMAHDAHGKALPSKVVAKGKGKRDALARAAALASSVVDNPVLRAALPPGADLAIDAVKKIATSSDVREALSHYAGPGAKRIVKALGF